MGIRVRRLLAWCIDWCCILGWVAVVAAVGVPLYLAGVVRLVGPMVQNLVGLIVIIPVVVAAAWRGSGPRSATPGKRVRGLVVRHGSSDLGIQRALARNALKIGVPWAVAHLAVFAIVDTATGRTRAWVGWLTAVAYVLPVLWVASLFLAGARTIYDRLTGTEVHGQSPTRSPWPASGGRVNVTSTEPEHQSDPLKLRHKVSGKARLG